MTYRVMQHKADQDEILGVYSENEKELAEMVAAHRNENADTLEPVWVEEVK